MGNNVLAYTARRLIAGIPVVFVVVFLTFALVYLTPGDAATVIAGEDATQEQIEAVRVSLGLDQPFLVQFAAWGGRLLSGDLGHSLVLPMSVGDALLARAEPTIMLALFAQFIAILIAIPLGVIAGRFSGRFFDRAVNMFAVAGIAVPTFVIGIGLIMLFSITLAIAPTGGYATLSEGLPATLGSLLLPAIALGVAQAAFMVRITRTSMHAVFRSDFVRAATMRGFSQQRLVFRHVIRPGLGPTISAIGISFATLISGSIVVEIVFNLPGLGRLLITAVQNRDIPVLQGLLLVITLCYVLINIITDVIQAIVNPRIAL